MKVSVLMCTYNQEEMIGQAIEGVLSQEVDFDYELIIGEDCSTDKTREIVEKYANQFPDKVRVILHSENVGPWHNGRLIWPEAKGEYIAYLDGDDYWTSTHKLQTQLNFLETHPDCSMCFHAVHRLYEDGTFERRPLGKTKPRYSLTDFFDDFPIPSCSPLYRASIAKDFNWAQIEGLSGDVALAIWHAKHGNVGYIDQVMGVYRIHAGGIFSMIDPEKQFDMRIRTLKTLNEMLDFQYDREIGSCISKFQCRLASVHSRNGQFGDAKRELKSVLKTANRLTEIVFSREFIAAATRTYVPLAIPVVDTIQRWIAGSART